MNVLQFSRTVRVVVLSVGMSRGMRWLVAWGGREVIVSVDGHDLIVTPKEARHLAHMLLKAANKATEWSNWHGA